MALRATSSGTISFGLVSIPVKLFTATSPENVSFNMIHKKCGGRVKMQYHCPTDNEVVERADTVKGFEHVKNQYVLFTDEELKKLEGEKTPSIEITEFVPAGSVDITFVEKTYFLGPDKGGDRAYQLLAQSMERKKRMAVARYGGKGKDQLVVVRAKDGYLILHQVYYATEVRNLSEIDLAKTSAFKAVEEELAEKLIDQLSADTFKPDQYRDTYRDRVIAAVEKKVEGQEVTVVPEQPKAQIIDLFEALKRSLDTPAKPANVEEAGAVDRPKGPTKASPRTAAAAKKKAG